MYVRQLLMLKRNACSLNISSCADAGMLQDGWKSAKVRILNAYLTYKNRDSSASIVTVVQNVRRTSRFSVLGSGKRLFSPKRPVRLWDTPVLLFCGYPRIPFMLPRHPEHNINQASLRNRSSVQVLKCWPICVMHTTTCCLDSVALILCCEIQLRLLYGVQL